jgi:hypothetical protein
MAKDIIVSYPIFLAHLLFIGLQTTSILLRTSLPSYRFEPLLLHLICLFEHAFVGLLALLFYRLLLLLLSIQTQPLQLRRLQLLRFVELFGLFEGEEFALAFFMFVGGLELEDLSGFLDRLEDAGVVAVLRFLGELDLLVEMKIAATFFSWSK